MYEFECIDQIPLNCIPISLSPQKLHHHSSTNLSSLIIKMLHHPPLPSCRPGFHVSFCLRVGHPELCGILRGLAGTLQIRLFLQFFHLISTGNISYTCHDLIVKISRLGSWTFFHGAHDQKKHIFNWKKCNKFFIWFLRISELFPPKLRTIGLVDVGWLIVLLVLVESPQSSLRPI